MLSIIIVLLTALSNFGIFAQSCDKELKEYNIIPDYVKSCGGKLQVSFDVTQVNCGSKVSIMETMSPPVVTFNARKQCKKYATILMVDLDSPVFGPYLHWSVINVPIRVLANGYSVDKKGYIEYAHGPTVPLAATGTDRYTYFLFCQDDKLPEKTSNIVINFLDRLFFNITNYQKSHNLGDPVACNFFILTLMGDADVSTMF